MRAPPAVARAALATSAAAPVALIGGWTLAAALRPDPFDPVSETISALAARGAPHREVMTAALAVLGACHLGTAAALPAAAPAGRLLLALGGAATVGVALLPLPAGGGPSTAHGLAAGVAFVALAAWPAAAWCPGTAEPTATGPSRPVPTGLGLPVPTGLGRPVPTGLRRPVATGAAAVLTALLGWFAVELAAGSPRLGLAERVVAGAQSLWPLAVVRSVAGAPGGGSTRGAVHRPGPRSRAQRRD